MIEAVCFDMGDTLVAEDSVVHDSFGGSITADVIEGVVGVLQAIKESGLKTAIIANGDSSGTGNIIDYCGLGEYFDAIVISDEVGVEKPAKGIFEAALKELGVRAENAIMVGNRIDADIVGANKMGMISVWFKWNNRYGETVSSEEEKPYFTINVLYQLLSILTFPRST